MQDEEEKDNALIHYIWYKYFGSYNSNFKISDKTLYKYKFWENRYSNVFYWRYSNNFRHRKIFLKNGKLMDGILIIKQLNMRIYVQKWIYLYVKERVIR